MLRDQGQLEQSCQAFQEGLKRSPGSKGLLQGLAISLGRRREFQQVIQLLTPVVEKALPYSGSGDNALADLLLELGNAHHALSQDDLALQRWKQGTDGAEGEKRLFMGLNIAQVLCDANVSMRQLQSAAACSPYFRKRQPRLRPGIIAKGNGQLEQAMQLLSRHWPGTRPTPFALTATACSYASLDAAITLDVASSRLSNTTPTSELP